MFALKEKLLCFLILSCTAAVSQNRNVNWCFGDSAGINFSNISSPLNFTSSVKSRGSSASVSDTAGQLNFYAYTHATLAGPTTKVFNRLHNQMPNGTGIVGEGWYKELCIIPFPDDLTKYYLFSIGVTGSGPAGLYYSIIDMTLDSGRGDISFINISLQNYEATDCVTAIKHGNGRDWWIFSRRFDNVNNEFYSYLISPSGVNGPSIQNIGTATDNGFYRMVFNSSGNLMIVIDYRGLIELYSFDRCTGLLSNHQIVEAELPNGPYPGLWDAAISPDDSKLYISTNGDTAYIFQYDLSAANIAQTKDTIFTQSYPTYTAAALKLAPDGKIYVAKAWYDSLAFFYPYNDSAYNIYNTYLSVINHPDSLGAACDYQPYSFYLGGNRTYLGLPNNPDYDMPAWVGSPCDTLGVGVADVHHASVYPELAVTYVSVWEMAFINATGLIGNTFSLSIFDMTGKMVLYESGKNHSSYFSKDINCSVFQHGLYVVSLKTESEHLTAKFLK